VGLGDGHGVSQPLISIASPSNALDCFLVAVACVLRRFIGPWSSLVADNGPSNPSEAHLTLDPTDSNQRLMGLLGMLHCPHPWITYVARTKEALCDA
jgi:hypothetical protein